MPLLVAQGMLGAGVAEQWLSPTVVGGEEAAKSAAMVLAVLVTTVVLAVVMHYGAVEEVVARLER